MWNKFTDLKLKMLNLFALVSRGIKDINVS
jgi:hypothetical protein